MGLEEKLALVTGASRAVASTPVKRPASRSKAPSGCRFQAGDGSNFMTGAEVVVDGGQLTQ